MVSAVSKIRNAALKNFVSLYPLIKFLEKTCENKSNLAVREILQFFGNGAKTVVAV